ncbi:MAG: sugar phosphate isomerase/epimerase [Planctomycetaceae bacterium]|nr:sugar phosphate isomerase/epimerase [Planctomycetaceae bacterium]
MKLGFVTAILPEFTLEEVFATAAELGFDCVEVMCWPRGKADRRYAGVTHIDADVDAGETGDQVAALTEKYGVTISGLGYYPNPLTPDDAEADQAIDHIKKLVQLTAKLGLNRMNSFIGRDWTKSVDDNWSRFLQVWRPIVSLAEEVGVRVGIENCPMLFSSDEWPGGKNLAVSPSVWQRMFDDIPSQHFGLNYDPSHMIWQRMDYLAPMRNFADRLFHIHAKDVRLDRHRLDQVGILAHPNEYHVPKLPGMGDVDWGKFFSVLTDVGYDGPVCVEVEDRAYEHSLEARKTSLRQSHTYLRNFVPPTVD